MLVLSRKMDEKIVIDDRITVTIVRLKGNTVSIGIEAPHEVPILRGELQRTLEAHHETSEARPRLHHCSA